MVVSALLISLIPNTSLAATGIGGGPSFQPGSVFPFIAGETSSLRSSFFVQNLGSSKAILEFGETGTEGITVNPLEDGQISLRSGESRTLAFDLTVEDFVPPGDYPLVLSLKQTNISKPTDGQTAYAPAISGNLTVRVRGSSATAIIEPVNADDKSPAVGNISLTYLPEVGAPLVIAEATGSSLTKRVIEGNYEASFRIEGLVEEKVEFFIRDGETKTVRIEIKGVQFLSAVARRQIEDGDRLIAAELAVAVRNQLDRLEGPIGFAVQVSRDGQLVEEKEFASLAELPIGTTEQRTSYTPDGGFTPGLWSFHFVVKGPGFLVESAEDPTISVDGPPFPWWLVVLFAIVGWYLWFVWRKKLTKKQKNRIKAEVGNYWAQLRGLLKKIWWWFLVLLKRRKKEEVEQATPGTSVKPTVRPAAKPTPRAEPKPATKAPSKSAAKTAPTKPASKPTPKRKPPSKG